MNRLFGFYFASFIVAMGGGTYFRYEGLPLYTYLLLLPFGALFAHLMCKFYLSHIKKVQDEIDSSKNKLAIMAMVMNHSINYISHGGTGAFYEKEFIFTRFSDNKKMMISLSDITKVSLFNAFFSKGIKVHLGNGNVERFFVKSDDLNKAMAAFSQKMKNDG